MKKTVVAAFVMTGSLASLPVVAQQIDNTETLPDAKPGECYAKVVTPAQFETRTEEVIVQESSERIETVPAVYETLEQSIIVKESSTDLTVVPATFEDQFEKVEVRPPENHWTVTMGNRRQPASPGALDGIIRSGVDLEAVEPGSCFREYFTEPEYRTETRRVLVREGSEVIEVTQAEYETVEERVIVKEASSKVVDVPAVYRTETESVLVEPARSVWKQGRGPVERIDDTTGEIMCLVEIPARYETITKTVLDTPATTKTVNVPAVYETLKVDRLVKPAAESRKTIEPEYANVTTRIKVADAGFFWLPKADKANSDATYSGREVCLTQREGEYTTVKRAAVKTPAKVEVAEVPAKRQTLKVERLVTPASERRIPIPARTKTVSRKVQIEPARLEWRQVLCETNITREIISDLQRALKREGFDPGPIDGLVGQATLNAVEKYQTKQNLDRGGLTYETLKSLKVASSS